MKRTYQKERNRNVHISALSLLALSSIFFYFQSGDAKIASLATNKVALSNQSNQLDESGHVLGASTSAAALASAASAFNVIAAAGTPAAGIVGDNQTLETARFAFITPNASHTIVKLSLTMSAAAAAMTESVMLYDGTTLLGSQPAAPIVSFPVLAWNIPANTSKMLSVKLKIGTVIAGKNGGQVDLKTTLSDFSAINNMTGVAVYVGNMHPSGNSLYVYAAVPTFTMQKMASYVLSNDANKPLMKFKLDPIGGPISWARLGFEVYKDADTKIATTPVGGISLWDVTLGVNKQIQGSFENSSVLYGAAGTIGTIRFTPKSEQIVSTTTIYELRGTITKATGTGDYVMVLLSNDGQAMVPMNTKAAIAADPDVSIVWSDMSAANHASGGADWFSSFGLKNLPLSSSLDW